MLETRTIEYDPSYHDYITYKINTLKEHEIVNIDIKKDPFVIEITGTEPNLIHIEIKLLLIIIKPILTYMGDISIKDINPIHHTNYRFITIITKLRDILYQNQANCTILEDWDIEKEYDTNEHLILPTNNINNQYTSFKQLNTQIDEKKTMQYLIWHRDQCKFLLNKVIDRLGQIKLAYIKFTDLEIKYNNYIISLKEHLFRINVNFYDIYPDCESDHDSDCESNHDSDSE